jgi:hypothetical protein
MDVECPGSGWTRRAALHDVLAVPRIERAIGVIYRPETERQSHYFDARLADQFDVAIHLDHTRALEPLERTSLWDQGRRQGRPPPAAGVRGGERRRCPGGRGGLARRGL